MANSPTPSSDPTPARYNLTVRTLPNAITASRLVLAPLTLWAHQLATAGGNGLEDPGQLKVGFLLLCLLGLVLAEISDGIDGAVARRTGSVSDLGKLLDPLADSIFRFLVFLGFFASGWMPLWMLVVYFVRDLLVAYLRVLTALFQVVLAARKSGKIKAICQATAQIATVVFFILHCWGVGEKLFGVPLPVGAISYAFLLVSTLVTAWSAWDYCSHVMRAVAQEQADE